MTYHFIGIGGAGMSVVARLLAARGDAVQGSDSKAGAVTAALESEGIRVFVGHDAAQVPAEATVVVSSAIREDNPELAVARSRGQRTIHRSEALALAAGGQDFIAVAGAHGKTTTSAMIAYGLLRAGRDPSFAIGGTVRGVGSGARTGAGGVFVAEADESDASFLNYTPSVEVVLNVEPDHLDTYGSAEAFERAFVDFAARLRPDGLLIVCDDDAGARRLAERVNVRTVRYGRAVEPRGPDLRVGRGRVSGDGWSVPLSLRVPGAHNELNAAAALAVARELGVDVHDMAEALSSFQGTGRRFEPRGERNGILVIDDYAHHPTEVAATIAAARERTAGNVRVLFQPHLYSRTENFASEFAHALDGADDVIVTAIYAAREEPRELTSRIVTDRMVRGQYIADRDEAARVIAARALPGDLVITMGAGDITEAADVVVEAL